ncbi:DUF1538 domain-containing protein [Anoxybacterium hadale]|uniref:DUF1538 domain-containing protein n=1 Tax=Anoxybacterium hadale TaxID=3408580 RepID=A0ACD1ADJ2_9FIRM|nr:DUF1538 domain-containing protein [Clostridiales bacterium]
MNKKLILKIKESLSSVLPISIIVLVLNFTITPMPFGVRGLFLVGAALLITGMGLFTLGADTAMMPMGEQIGGQLIKSRKLSLLIVACLIMGTMITIAEPDLQVLAEQVPSVPNMVLILWVAAGVGVFLVVALLRILFQWRLSYILIGLYVGVFALGAFTSESYLAVAFDSGGVTTGPITVPFILALGIGLSSVRGGKSSHDDSFGLVALCSVGPILAVMIMGMFFNTTAGGHSFSNVEDITSLHDIFQLFGYALPKYAKEVAIALSPIIVFFILFQLFSLKLPKSQLIKLSIGIAYTYFGLVLFLAGVNIGFLPAGSYIGEYIGGLPYNWILIPLGMVMGFFIVAAEPAVHVLNDEVEVMTGGAVSKNAMLWSLSIGVAVSIGLAMIRVLTGTSIWFFLVPGYLIALALTFFVPKIFTAIAFDSGGVASGPMTATFLLPFTMGACEAVGGNILTDAFGVVAMVAMTPLITIQVMGLIYNFKMKDIAEEEEDFIEDIAEDIVEEEEGIEWYGQSCDVAEHYGWMVDTEFIENIEWASDLREEKIYNDRITDNDYIDFEELQKLVIREDFDDPRNR